MDMIKVNAFHVSDFPNGIARDGKMAILTGLVAPAATVPDFVGQIYIDTVLGVAYIAIGITASDFVTIGHA